MRAIAALLVALCSGCSAIVSLDQYDEGGVAASSSGGGSGAAGTGGSGAAGGAGGQGAGCGDFLHPAASSLVDDFEDGVSAPGWTDAPSSCPPAEIGGQLVATPPGAPNKDFCFHYTTQAYHLTCSQIAFRVDEATSNEQGVQTLVYLDTLDGLQRIHLLKDISGFNFAQPDADYAILVSGSYDPIADRWWRLRHDGETLFFETAPDGLAWQVRGSGQPPMSLDALIIQLGAGTYLELAAPGTARFDCYNVPAADCP